MSAPTTVPAAISGDAARTYLIRTHWRIIGRQGNVTYWTHDNHQCGGRGVWTTTSAISHQRNTDLGVTCRCTPKDEKDADYMFSREYWRTPGKRVSQSQSHA